MPSAKDLKNELRDLRKTHPDYMPVSKLKKADVSSQIERLKMKREETPAVAAVPSAPLRKSKAAVETIKEAKASEFPVKPAEKKAAPKTKSGMNAAASAPASKKKSKMDKLMALMEAMSSSEEE